MTTLEILEKARAKIADPKRWTTGHDAIDANGYSIAPDDPSAACWCGRGAVYSLGTRTQVRVAINALYEAAIRLFQGEPVGIVNDKRGHAAILQVFDLAISNAKVEATDEPF